MPVSHTVSFLFVFLLFFQKMNHAGGAKLAIQVGVPALQTGVAHVGEVFLTPVSRFGFVVIAVTRHGFISFRHVRGHNDYGNSERNQCERLHLGLPDTPTKEFPAFAPPAEPWH
jgi:hypothetical protein